MFNKNYKNLVYVQGGLGNQLFCYAFGLYLLTKYKEEKLVKLYLSRSYSNINPECARVFLLDKYNCRLKSINGTNFTRRSFEYLKVKFITKISSVILEEDNNRFNEEYIKKAFTKRYIFEGFFQSYKYLEPVEQQLRNDLILKEELPSNNKLILSKIKNSNSISIHIRRGDYLSISESLVLSLDYYVKSINLICSLSPPPYHFYIFSDDIDWVKQNLKLDHPHTFVDINSQADVHFDLELMRNCKHNIIANSTFSFWAAWLNNNPDKIICYPKNWKSPLEDYSVFPLNWNII